MRFLALVCLLGTVLAAVITMSGVCSARNTSKHDCVSFAEASKHVGTTQCVSGTVLHVAEGTNGVTFLTFSRDHKTCPFTVVVLPDDLKTVGDIQQLEGQMVEIKGTIQGHDGRAEIVLRHTQQLGERVRRRSCGAQPTTTSNVGATTVRRSTAIPRPRRQLRSRAGRFQSRIPESPSSGRRSRSTRLTPIPCATRPADTSSPATRCHHSRAYRTSSAAICT